MFSTSARNDRTFLIFYLDTFMKVLGQHQPPGELRCCLASILQITHIPPPGVWRAQFNMLYLINSFPNTSSFGTWTVPVFLCVLTH